MVLALRKEDVSCQHTANEIVQIEISTVCSVLTLGVPGAAAKTKVSSVPFCTSMQVAFYPAVTCQMLIF